MATDSDRDRSIDQLLKGARRGAVPGPAGTDACIDAERLAAWADGTLSEPDARAIETHLSNCARCQSLAAAFASSEDVATPAANPPAQVIPLRRKTATYWLPLAAGTIAATLLVWIGTRDRNATQTPATTQTMSEAVATPAAPAPAPPTVALPAEAANTPAPRAALTPPARSEAVATPKATQSQELQRSAVLQERVAAAPALPAKTAAAPPPPAVMPPPTLIPTQADTRASSVSGLPQSSVSVTIDGVRGAPPQTQAKSAMNQVTFLPGVSSASPAVIAEFSSDQVQAVGFGGGGAAGAGGRGGGGAGRGAAGGGAAARPAGAAAAMDVVGLVQHTYWRILAGDVLQKSFDRATWETVTIDPPAPGLSIGAAPLPLVCWIAGKNGLVLLSIDGRQFARLSPPASADIVLIRAVDARAATVRTSDGQLFETTDGGKTWVRR